MMIVRAKKLIPLLIFFSLSCGLVEPVSTPAPTLAPVMETSPDEEPDTAEEAPMPTLLATETALSSVVATSTLRPLGTPTVKPDDLVDDENLIPPPAVSPGANFRLENEILNGAYGIRFWRNTTNPLGFEDVVIIEKTGVERVVIESAAEIVTLTESDINADGFPDVIVETYSGGAHCCFSTQVYSLGETPKLILSKPESNTSGEFKDLDKDGIYEFITADDVFAYQYCPYVSSPVVKVIMSYDAEDGKYFPASPYFPEQYEDEIDAHTTNAVRVARANTSENGEWDETTKCSILPITLDHIYLGDLEKARAELDSYYAYDDIDRFWNEIMLIVQDSPLYVAKEE